MRTNTRAKPMMTTTLGVCHRQSRARTRTHNAPSAPRARTNTHAPRPATAARRQARMSMSMLQHKHIGNVWPFFCMHSACSRQWPCSRPSQGTQQTACSAPARPRGHASVPAGSEGGGERGGRCGDARRERGEVAPRRSCSDTVPVCSIQRGTAQ